MSSSQSSPDARLSHGAPLGVLTLSALGVVFGDIGTSPLYALRECFYGRHARGRRRTSNVLGVLSLIFWALVVVISIKYISFVMRADNQGEGGILALMALVPPTYRGPQSQRPPASALGLFGAALLYGDGIITPAIIGARRRRRSEHGDARLPAVRRPDHRGGARRAVPRPAAAARLTSAPFSGR